MERSVPVDQAPAASSILAALRSFVWAAVVLAGTVAALLAVDALPGLLRDTARGVVRYDSVADLEHAVGRRMPEPVYYPSTLEWPPSDQRAYLGRSAAYWCRSRVDGRLALVIAVAGRRDREAVFHVLPPAAVLQSADGSTHGRPAVVTRLRDEAGVLWQQIEWDGAGGVTIVRSRGTLDELMRIVSSLRE
jgi:hypothetical protein